MKSKRLLVLLALFFVGIIKVNAAYLKDYVSKYTNPDGKEVTVYITGDEYFRYTHDKKKNVLIKNNQGYYTYATIKEGKVVSTNHIYDMKNIPFKTIKVGDIDLNKNQNLVHKFDQNNKKKSQFKSSKKRSQKEGSIDDVLNFNTTVVFVRFKGEDEFVTNSLVDSLKSVLGTTNNDTTGLKSYVNKVTEGHINTNSNLLQVNNNKYYSYVSEYSRGYLQEKSSYNTIGYTSIDEGDKRLLKILNAAVKSLPETETINIDANQDGYVDNFIFIVSGYSDGWNEPLWPHKWSLSAAGDEQQYSGAWVDSYNLQFADNGDLSSKVSVFCHETMHSLGMPDLYRYYSDGDPVGPWDMMNEDREGSYVTSHIRNRWGYTKLESQIWSSEPTVIEKSGTYELNLVSTNNGIRTYRINTEDEDQFIQLEYRGSTGDVYDSNIPYDGLLVSRINLNYEGNYGDDDPEDEYYIYRPNENQYRVGGGGDIEDAAIAPCSGLINCSNSRGVATAYSSLTNGAFTLENNTNTRLVVKNVEYAGANKIKFSVFLNGEKVYIDTTEYSGLVGDTFTIKPIYSSTVYAALYSSNSNTVASVETDGTVTLNSVGHSTITTRIDNKNYYTEVYVMPAKINSLNLVLTDAESVTLNYEVSGFDVTSYLIYRSEDGENFDLLATTDNTTYVDNSLVFGKTYYYKVGYVYDEINYDSNLIKSVNTLDFLPSKTNINNAIINSITSGRIEFTSVDDADGYNILVSDNPIGPFTILGDTTNNYYDLDLEVANNYYIKVSSYKLCNNNNKYESEYSNVVLLNTREKLLQAPIITNGQLISINQITIYYNGNENASGYNIYVSNDNKNFTLLKSDNKELSYTHEGVEFGKTYYYKVSSILDDNYEGYRSNSYKVTANQITPSNFKVKSNGFDSILISYDEIDNATGYEIYYSTDNNKFKLLVDTNKTSYKHGKLKFNKTYYYKVRSYREVNNKKIYSNYSLVLSAKTLTSAPKVTITQLDNGKIKLDYSSDKYANSYKIYLQTDGENYNLLTTTSKKSYTIKNLELGQKINVKVVSYKNSIKGNETVVEYTVTLRSPIIKLNGNTISIDGVPGANFYDVYRCGDECALLASIDELQLTSDSINNEGIYSYYVVSYNDEYISGKSNYVSNISSFKINSVNVVSSDSNEAKFVVSTENEFDGYELLMSSKKKSGYKKVMDSNSKEFKYNKTALNKTYYFKINPYKIFNGKKYYAKSSSVITYKQTLNKIDSIKLENINSSSIKVSFNKVKGVKGYNLYYKIGDSGSFKKVSLKKNNYVLNNLSVGDTVYFKVNSYIKSGKKTITSKTSDVKSIVVKSPIPKYSITSLTPTSVRIDIDTNELNAYSISYGLSENELINTILINNNTVTINNLEPNNIYYFKVSERKGGVVGEGEVKSHSLNAVTPNINFTRIDKNTANLTWDSQGDNVYYEVYLQNNKIYEGTRTSLKEEKLVTGKEYTYKIRSYIVVNEEKQYSDFKELSVRCLPDRINSFVPTINSSLNRLNVDFDGVEGDVSYYKLLMTNSLDAPYVEIATSDTNNFSNVSVTPGKTYYLKVAAVILYNNQEYYDDNGNYIVFKALPKAPSSVSVLNNTYNSLKVEWSKVIDVNGYEVYFSTKEKSGYKKVTSTSSTSFTHKKLKVNTKYYYKVRTYKTINGKKYYSDYSNVISKKALPNVPKGLKVTRYDYSSTKNTVTWKAVSEVSGYYVYNSHDGVNYYYIGKTTSTKFVDKSAFYYGTYYKVKSYKTVGGKKYFSNYSDYVFMGEPEDPSFSIHNSSEQDSNALYSIKTFTNSGDKPITILSSGAYSKDADYSSLDRKMTLVDTSTAKEIKQVVVEEGE